MSNNYLQFSFAIPNLTQAEAAWVQAYMAHVRQFAEYEHEREWVRENNAENDVVLPVPDEPVMTDADKADPFLMTAHENGSFGFSWAIDEDGLWIYAEESGDPDSAATLVQRFLKAHRPTAYVGFEWAATCSKMRLDEFSGGAVFITADDCTYLSTSRWLMEQRDLLTARRLVTEA